MYQAHRSSSTRLNVGISRQSVSHEEGCLGRTQGGVSVKQVESAQRLSETSERMDNDEKTDVSDKINFTDLALAQLCNSQDHFEITGTIRAKGTQNTGVHVNQIYNNSDGKPNSFKKAWRAAVRSQPQQDAYRQGIDNIRNLLRQEYAQNAVNHFDNRFAYRRWAGKPLAVRALKAFISKEHELRQGTVNISTIGKTIAKEGGEKKLEGLKEKLSVADEEEWSVIGGSKVPSAAKTDYAFPFLPIKRSWFEFSANAEDLKKGREEGLGEAKKAILALLEKPITKKHVSHLFDARFAVKIKNTDTLTVEELTSFIDTVIQIRDHENGMCGAVYQVANSAKDAGEDVTIAVRNFLKGAYHAVGIAAGAAVVANAEAGCNNPITALEKGIATGALVATETDTQRIMTALADYCVATSAAAPQTSITSSVLKFFTFGLY